MWTVTRPRPLNTESERLAARVDESHIGLFGLSERLSGFCVLTGNVCAAASHSAVPSGQNQPADHLYRRPPGAARAASRLVSTTPGSGSTPLAADQLPSGFSRCLHQTGK